MEPRGQNFWVEKNGCMKWSSIKCIEMEKNVKAKWAWKEKRKACCL